VFGFNDIITFNYLIIMTSKSQSTHPIPAGISEYIKQNFREDYLTEITSAKDAKGIEFFYVDVTHEDNIFHLKFNGNGELIQKEVEPVRYPDDEVELGTAD
jgi:hypothetical protein